MSMGIRTATPGDWDEIRRISAISGYMDYIGRIGPRYMEWGTILVAYDERMLGFLKMERLQDNSAWLGGLRVDPSRRREGVARFLTDEAVKEAGKTGLDFARMIIHTGNLPSLNLARKCGFTEILEYDFYQGSIDLKGYSPSDRTYAGPVFDTWRIVMCDDTIQMNGAFLSSGQNKVYVSESDRNRFYHLLNGAGFREKGGNGVVVVPRGVPGMESLRRIEDFDTGIVFEKSTKH